MEPPLLTEFRPPASVEAALGTMDEQAAAAARDGVPFCQIHGIRYIETDEDFVCPRCEALRPVPPPKVEQDTLFGVSEDPQSGAIHIRAHTVEGDNVTVTHDPRDPEAGKSQREAAVAQVTNAAPADWLEDAFDALVAVAGIKRLSGSELSTDDVWALLAARGIDPPPERRAMAAVIRRAEREELIEKTDRFVPSALPWAHRRNTQVWRVL